MKNKTIKLDRKVQEYFKLNPSIKNALKIFNISNKTYQDSIRSSNNPKIIISTKSTIYG